MNSIKHRALHLFLTAVVCSLLVRIATAGSEPSTTTTPAAARAVSASTRATGLRHPWNIRLYLEDVSVEPRAPSTLVISVRNDTEKAQRIFSAVEMIPMIRESDGTVRPAKSALNAPPAPAPSRKPDDDFAAMFDGCMHLIVTIKGDFDEPVEPFMELHGSRLEAIDFEPGVVHFFQKSINGGKLVRGNYDLEAKLLNGAEVVATSRVHSIEVSRKASN